MKGLSPKRQRFVNEYCIDQNGAQAAIRAGYSSKTAHEQAAQLLANLSVRQAVDQKLKGISERLEVKAERVLLELSRLAFSDIRKLFDEQGRLKDPKEWDPDTAAVVSSIEILEAFEGKGEDRVFVGYTKKVKLWDKNSALEKLGKYLKLFVERVEFPDKNGNPQLLTDIELSTRLAFILAKAAERVEK